ncbi:hypothetical protein U1737_17180 [Sphingomonas sp. LB3N6]|uniref:hypothetical protein n=1 Tax=Sphingomonas fucosidasi TaxID=3096164 RepID=UPI002FCBF73A
MDWKADSVQAVMFIPPTDTQRDALALWALVFPNNSPDAFQKAAASPNLHSSASGERNGFNITIGSQVGRIDVSFGPVMPPMFGLQPVLAPPRISDIQGAVYGANAILKTLGGIFSPSRIAIVLDMAVTVAAGNEVSVLRSALPSIPIPDNSSDTVVQFNVPRSFEKYPMLPMNRLCTWSVGEIGFIIGNNLGTAVNNGFQLTRFVGFKIDLNTAPNHALLGYDVSILADELAAEAGLLLRDGLGRLL